MKKYLINNRMNIIEIVFLGGGTSFYEVFEIIRRVNLVEHKYKIIAILDDNPELHGKYLNGILIEGPLSNVDKFPNAKFIFGIGSMKTRLVRNQIFKKLNLDLSRFETVIHPQANIDLSAKISPGCIIHPGACIGNDVIIDPFVIIAVNTAIGPYTKINSFAMITSLVVVLSNAKIGMAAFIGSCSCITENVSIGKGVMIGAGTIISRDIPDGSFFLGNPARMINKIELQNDF